MDYEMPEPFTTETHENTGRLCDQDVPKHPYWGKQHNDTIPPGEEHRWQVGRDGHIHRRPQVVAIGPLVRFDDLGTERSGWVIGKPLWVDDVYCVLVQISGVEFSYVPEADVYRVRVVDAPF